MDSLGHARQIGCATCIKFMKPLIFVSQIDDINRELEEVRQMAAQYEAEIAEESEGQSYELMGSQVR